MVKVEGGIQVRYYQQGTVLPIFYVILAFALILTILDPDICKVETECITYVPF